MSKIVEHPPGGLHCASEHQTGSKQPWLKYRYVITFLSFLLIFSVNAYRMNMSVAIVAMVNNSAAASEIKSQSCLEVSLNETTADMDIYGEERDLEGKEFNWSPKIQGYILASYFLSYTVMPIFFGKLMERYGCKWFLFGGTLVVAVGTLVIPVASSISAYAVIVTQVARGIAHGTYYPGIALLTANWFPRTERGLLNTFVHSGSALGACVGGIFSGLLCKSALLGGWRSSFYVFGACGVVVTGAFGYFAHESPNVHPTISKRELQYILTNQENVLHRRRPKTPWTKMLTSLPVYGMAIGLFGQLWAVSQFLIVHSTFLGTILHYPIKQNGLYSAAPFLIMFICTQISSWLSSLAMNRKYATINQIRKFWNLVFTLGYSGCIVVLYYAGCDRLWSVAFSVLSMGFVGFGLSGCWIVYADMSPTFAASLNALTGTFGCSSTFILPLVVGYLTNEEQTIEQWNKVFLLTVGIVLSTGVIFAFFGSADIQPWNYEENSSERAKNENLPLRNKKDFSSTS